jgi:hypothetical protein
VEAQEAEVDALEEELEALLAMQEAQERERASESARERAREREGGGSNSEAEEAEEVEEADEGGGHVTLWGRGGRESPPGDAAEQSVGVLRVGGRGGGGSRSGGGREARVEIERRASDASQADAGLQGLKALQVIYIHTHACMQMYNTKYLYKYYIYPS